MNRKEFKVIETSLGKIINNTGTDSKGKAIRQQTFKILKSLDMLKRNKQAEISQRGPNSWCVSFGANGHLTADLLSIIKDFQGKNKKVYDQYLYKIDLPYAPKKYLTLTETIKYLRGK